jgi:phospholipase C
VDVSVCAKERYLPKFLNVTNSQRAAGALFALALGGCGGGSGFPGYTRIPVASHTTYPAPTPDITAIAHVVVIMQENRSFDNLFNGFPGANTAQSGIMSNGTTVTLRPTALTVPADIDHSHQGWWREYAGGKLFFDQDAPQGQPADYPYAYVEESEIAPYWALANAYTLADETFQSNNGPSFPSHQYLIAAQSQGADENPTAKSPGWGCDDPAGTTVGLIGPNGVDSGSVFPCFNYETIGDELDAAHISWKYYAPALASSGAQWSAYDAIQHIRFGPDWSRNVISPETTVLQDIANGNLATVSWVVPNGANSDHAPSATGGPAWVSSVVSAIGNSQYWNSTAIFIAWDDWGGWYDHVPPAQIDEMGLGFRVPLLVVSPYARHGYVSHIAHESPVSILAYIEHRFGLAPLTQRDLNADDLNDCFDYSQSVAPFIKLPRPAHAMQWSSTQPPDND